MSAKTEQYYSVVISFEQDHTIHVPEIDRLALDGFSCIGIEEFSLEESQVDEILGDRAYSGGDVPKELLDEVEKRIGLESIQKRKYSFCGSRAKNNANQFYEKIQNDYENLAVVLNENQVVDWNAQWREHYSPIEISPTFRVIPSWLKGNDESNEEIYIYPGMGFGTGGHETTFLCLKLFEEIVPTLPIGANCLDFGCGSGILGIAAIKRRSANIDFCDIDKSALENCLQNLELNFLNKNLSETRLVLRERFSPEKKYKIIFANILKNVLEMEWEFLTNCLADDGHIVVSGLLKEQLDDFIRFAKEYSVIKMEALNDWGAILFIRK